MVINPEIISLVEKKYREMTEKKLSEDFLDTKLFGGLKVFINKPKIILFSVKIDDNLTVYLGSESM